MSLAVVRANARRYVSSALLRLECLAMLSRLLALAFAVLLSGAVAEAQEFKSGGITVVTPWARATPGGAKIGGAYLDRKSVV